MTLSEAFALYDLEEIKYGGMSEKTSRNFRSTLSSLLKCTPDIPVELLTKSHVINWKLYRERLGHADSTVAHDLGRLKSVLRYLRREGYTVLDEAHIKRPKLKERTYTWLDHAEVMQLLSVIDSTRDRAIFACLWSTGCRISELLNIDRADITGNAVEIIGKGSRVGTVYLDKLAQDCLAAYLAARKDNLKPLFVSGQKRRITVSRVGQLLHEYTAKAGIDKNVTPHVIRHSFGTDLKMNGADIYDIQKQLRHKRISSTQLYVHINNSQVQENHRRFHTEI